MNPDLSLNLLRRANSELGTFFAHFSGVPVLGTDDEVQALMQVERALRSVARLLDGGLEESTNPEMQHEIACYRANLLQLRRELAVMQNSAASCRSQLLEQQKHLHAARAWCDASRTTQ